MDASEARADLDLLPDVELIFSLEKSLGLIFLIISGDFGPISQRTISDVLTSVMTKNSSARC